MQIERACLHTLRWLVSFSLDRNAKYLDIFDALAVKEICLPERSEMKKPAHLPRGAFYLLLVLAVSVIPFALAHRETGERTQSKNPSGFVCYGCPSNGWHPGPDMPTTAVHIVGFYFWPDGNFYVVGGRSMDGVGNDFTHPFEFNRGTNSWSI
jgi:hypothetical protein